MIKKLTRQILIAIIFLFCLSNKAEGQIFYKDYKNYLATIKCAKKIKNYKQEIDLAIKRLRIAIDSNKKINNRPFFSTDTVYIVSFIGVETGFPSAIIWNKRTSCYYRYSYEIVHWKKRKEQLEIQSDASLILNSFHKDFREIVENGDTTSYHKYAERHKVFDGEWITPLIAIRTNNHWQFTTFSGNGWAVNVDSAIK